MAVDLTAATTFYPGYQAQFGVEQFVWSAQGNDIEHSLKADKIDGSGFGTRVKNDLPGMQEGSLKVKGMAAYEKGAINYWIGQWFGRKSPVNAWYALEGLQSLQPITMQPSSIIDASRSAKLKDPLDFSLELAARGAYNDGVILLSPTAELSGSSGTGSLDDNTLYGGATTTGGAAQLHVIAIDGGTSPAITVNIQHSPDGTTWTNLTTFNAASTLGSQRITLPSTTTINTKVQATWTISGSPTGIQVLLGFARGVNLNV